MTKTIGWILLAILNVVFIAVSVFALVDNIQREVSPVVPIIFIVVFLFFTYVWTSSAVTEWKEYKAYINEED